MPVLTAAEALIKNEKGPDMIDLWMQNLLKKVNVRQIWKLLQGLSVVVHIVKYCMVDRSEMVVTVFLAVVLETLIVTVIVTQTENGRKVENVKKTETARGRRETESHLIARGREKRIVIIVTAIAEMTRNETVDEESQGAMVPIYLKKLAQLRGPTETATALGLVRLILMKPLERDEDPRTTR